MSHIHAGRKILQALRSRCQKLAQSLFLVAYMLHGYHYLINMTMYDIHLQKNAVKFCLLWGFVGMYGRKYGPAVLLCFRNRFLGYSFLEWSTTRFIALFSLLFNSSTFFILLLAFPSPPTKLYVTSYCYCSRLKGSNSCASFCFRTFSCSL